MTSRIIKIVYFIYIFIIYIGGATVLTESDTIIFATFLFSFVLFMSTNEKFDKGIIYLLFLLSFINLVSIIMFGLEVSIVVLVGYYLRLLTVYFTIKYLNKDFFIFFKKGIYLMAILSVPFYLVQLTNINFFINNFPEINMSGEIRASVNYWNFFVYTAHQGLFNGIARNSGFAVEPGHFGYLLGFGIILELLDSDFKINKRIVIEVLVGLTTFSTTFYIVVAIILVLIQFNKAQQSQLALLILPIILYGAYLMITSDIVTDKVEQTIYSNEYQKEAGYDKYKVGEILNRLGTFEVGLENFVKLPTGHGMNPAGLVKNSYGDILSGPNSFAWLMTQWGVFFIFALPFLVLRFFNTYAPYLNNVSKFLLLVIMVIWLNSSIPGKDFLFFTIVIISIIKLKFSPSFNTIQKSTAKLIKRAR